jgi:glutamine cyclotransferase
MKMIKSLFGLLGLLSSLYAAPHNTVKWQEIYNVKELNDAYVPQGIEVYKDFVLFTIHAKDTKSVLIVFQKKEKKLEYLFEVDMPPEATHVSDLNVLGKTLYAIDYASNKIFEIDLETLVQKKRLLIKNEFYLGMSRTGSLVIIEHNNEKYVLFSRFILSNKLYAFKLSEMQHGGDLDKSKIAFSVTNHRFVQGLYAKENILLIATNNFGVDTITMVNIADMIETKSVKNATINIINAPYKMVEDLTMYEGKILTSDEESFFIYESEVLIK